MRSLILTTFLLLLSIINGLAQKDTLKTFNQGEVRNISGAVFKNSDNIHIANLSGFEFVDFDQSSFIEKVIEFQTKNIGVFDLGVSTISVQSIDGFANTLKNAKKQVDVDNYVLFCYGLNPNADLEELRHSINFWVELELGLSDIEEAFLKKYLAEELNLKIINDLLGGAIIAAEEYGLRLLEDYLNSEESSSIFEFPLDTEGLEQESISPKYSRWYLAPNGQPIKLPNSVKSLVVTNKKYKGGFPTLTPFGFRIKEADGDLIRYYSIRSSSDSTYSHGYAKKVEITPDSFANVPFIFEDHKFTVGSEEPIFFTSIRDECGSYELNEYLYRIQPLSTEARITYGRKVSDEEIKTNIFQEQKWIQLTPTLQVPTVTSLKTIQSVQIPCAPYITQGMFDTLSRDHLYYDSDNNIHLVLTEAGPLFYYYDLAEETGLYLYKYDYNGGVWGNYEIDNISPVELFIIALQKAADTHFLLDVVGVVPAFGEFADISNGIIYAIEGDTENATLSFGAAIPWVGIYSSGGKIALKSKKTGKPIARIGSVDEAGELTNNKENLETALGAADLTMEQRKAFESILGTIKNSILAKAFIDNPALIKIWKSLYHIPSISNSIPVLKIAKRWSDAGIELTFEIIEEGGKILNKNGDEIGRFLKKDNNVIFEIADDFFVDANTISNSFGDIEVVGNTGETFINPGFINLGDGTIGFVEDVSSYGTALVQNAIKKRGKLRGLIEGILKNQDAHHIIPVQLLKENDVVKAAVEAGFDFNSVDNGIAIEKFVKATNKGRHGPHPRYTRQIAESLSSWAASKGDNFTSNEAKEFLIELIEGNDIFDGVRKRLNDTKYANFPLNKVNEVDLQLPIF